MSLSYTKISVHPPVAHGLVVQQCLSESMNKRPASSVAASASDSARPFSVAQLSSRLDLGDLVPLPDSDDEYPCAADAVVARLSGQQPQAFNSEMHMCL